MAKTHVPAEKFTQLIQASGLPTEEKSGFLKVCGPGGALYVARGKTVARVDVSGFRLPTGHGIVDLGDKSFGRVSQQLDFSMTEGSVLNVFQAALEALKSTQPVVKPAREKRHGAVPRAPRQAKQKTEAPVVYGCQTRAEAYGHRIPLLKAAYQRMLQRKASEALRAEQPEDLTDFSAEVGPVLSDEALDFLCPPAGAKELMA